jgi:hypothetical protein
MHSTKPSPEIMAKLGEIGGVGYLHRLNCTSPFRGPATRCPIIGMMAGFIPCFAVLTLIVIGSV